MVRKGKAFLIKDMAKPKHFSTGQAIPESGICAIHHAGHRLPHEVTLMKGERFPRCGQCSDRVVFALLRGAPDIYSAPEFQVRLYELPEIPTADVSELEGSAEQLPRSMRKVV